MRSGEGYVDRPREKKNGSPEEIENKSVFNQIDKRNAKLTFVLVRLLVR